MNHDVFISYSSVQKAAAEAICHLLEQNDIRCWMAPRDIPGGAQYGDVIDDAIKTCRAVVVLFSKSASESQWVAGELNVAFEEQKIIIPFRLDETPLKGQNRVILNQKHWIDAYPDYKTKFNDLVIAVQKAFGNQVSPMTPQPPMPQPTPWYKKLSKKTITCILAIIVVCIACICSYPFLKNALIPFSYDNNGFQVSAKNLTDEQKSALTSILDDMVHVEGGEFVMGNNPAFAEFLTDQDSLSTIRHKVSLSNFYIGKYEITQEQWKAFCSWDGHCIDYEPNKPVDQVTWEEAKHFADTLSALTGLAFSLPTEAQWEYAARGGKQTRNYMYSGSNESEDVAWTCDDNLKSPQEVGNGKSKRGNELNLCDMTGNVSEWCLDYYAPYSPKTVKDPQGPSTGSYRICRGGDYTIGNVFDDKTTTRYYFAPFNQRNATGLRLVINKKD